MAPLAKELELDLFTNMSKHPRCWEQGVEMLRPFLGIRDRGAFPTGVRAEVQRLTEPAICSLMPEGEHVRFEYIDAERLKTKKPKDVLDLTDILRSSRFKEDIPPNHLFTSMSYILGSTFVKQQPHSSDPQERDREDFVTALAKTLHVHPQRKDRWLDLVNFNYGGLWMHLLWHAFNGREAHMSDLQPLCALMSLTPVIGLDRERKTWIILSP